MDHRHLHPNEFDLLLDGDVGFGLAPLKAHVRQCPDCQAELDQARQVVALLDELPHFAPAPLFADRVMAHVEPFVPWHVALRDSVLRLVPRSRPTRVLAAAGAFVTALLVSVSAIALLGRLDVVVFGWSLAVERGRAFALGLIGDTVSTVFGEEAVRSLGTAGPGALLFGGALLLASIVAAALLLRTAAAVSRGRTS